MVFSYDRPSQKTFSTKDTIYSHFRSDIPRDIEAVLNLGNKNQIFTKLNVFFIDNYVQQMSIVAFRSSNKQNMYKTTDQSQRPKYVTAAVALNLHNYLFFGGDDFYLFKKNNNMRKWRDMGKVAC